VPSDDVNLAIDLDKLPEGALYIRCDQLKCTTARKPTIRRVTSRWRRAAISYVQSREFYGRADIIKYDESKELVVFEASEGNLATLYRQKEKGGPMEELKGKKFITGVPPTTSRSRAAPAPA